MKQHITPKQLNELSEKGKSKLFVWLTKKGYHDGQCFMCGPDVHAGRRKTVDKIKPLLSIGQMLEFLSDKNNVKYPITIHERFLDWKVVSRGSNEVYTKGLELCDALWEAVKDILNEP